MADGTRATSGLRLLWVVRVGWGVLPLLAGTPLADAFSDRSASVQRVGSVALWAGWGVVACASFVRHPLSLTLLRAGVPAAIAAASGALAFGANATSGWIAVGATVAIAAVAFLPETAMPCVNGPAYVNERRYPLRAPGPLVLGPIAVAWILAVALPYGALLLLASKQWALGGVALVAGVACAALLGRSMHTLARRWIVFVPAGIVLHDPMQLADPVLFRRRDVRSLAAAPADTTALDLTARAFGLALELDVSDPAPIALQKPGSRVPELTTVSTLIFTPTRPGAVLEEARSRRFD